MFKQMKKLLKKILPPPTNTFFSALEKLSSKLLRKDDQILSAVKTLSKHLDQSTAQHQKEMKAALDQSTAQHQKEMKAALDQTMAQHQKEMKAVLDQQQELIKKLNSECCALRTELLRQEQKITELQKQNQKYYHQTLQFFNQSTIDDTSLSIIIPVYNAERYLSKCLDSITENDIPNIEIICINDCSTDQSLKILQEHSAKDPRIKIINKEKNEGTLLARKAGVDVARGSHIVFMDQDDYVAEDFCEFAQRVIRIDSADIIQFSVGIEDYSGDEIKTAWYKKVLYPDDVKLFGRDILKDAFITRSHVTTMWGKLFKTELCKKAYNVLPSEFCVIGEDIYLYFALAYFANSYSGIRSKEYYIYRHGLGATNTDIMCLDKFEKYCNMARLCQYTQHTLLIGCCDSVVTDAFEAMIARMSMDCFRIYKDRIAEQDLEDAWRILLHYWSAFPSAQEAAQKLLGRKLQ